tara:strand:- start:380 stop:844 length:465 start_codon:yes stop_codon:yes gene_type:complete
MNKLGRNIRIKFIYSDELLKKILGDQDSDHLYKMKQMFAKEELIKFDPLDKPKFEKELLTFSNTFTFYSYKDFAETLKEYQQFTVLSYRITDNNPDAFNSKQYSRCWASDISGIKIVKSFETYIDLEKRKYELVRTKAGAKYSVKKVYYYGREI